MFFVPFQPIRRLLVRGAPFVAGVLFVVLPLIFWRQVQVYLKDNAKSESTLPTTGVPQTIPKTKTDKKENLTTCEKRKNVAFLKVHKTGSTTVQNIFLRFAENHNLNVVLPKLNEHAAVQYLGFGTTVNKTNIIPIPDNETYNILCNHVVYDRHAFGTVMPPDSAYIGIVREPRSHFISSFLYYGLGQLRTYKWSKDDPEFIMERFLTQPLWYNIPNFQFLHNRMSFDFGLKQAGFHTDASLDNFITKLDSEFVLVMVLELFDESLLLLKRRLCWDVRDILYSALNKNEASGKSSIKMSSATEEKLQAFNFADFRLYDYFKERILTEIHKEGDDFQEELRNFKSLQNGVMEYCSSMKRPNSFLASATKWHPAFSLKYEFCYDINRPEIEIIRSFIDRAYRHYNNWKAIGMHNSKRKRRTRH